MVVQNNTKTCSQIRRSALFSIDKRFPTLFGRYFSGKEFKQAAKKLTDILTAADATPKETPHTPIGMMVQ